MIPALCSSAPIARYENPVMITHRKDRAMTKDERLQLWVRLSSMPYSGGIVPLLDRLNHGTLMHFLDQLAERLTSVASEGTQNVRELTDLREDVAALGRVLRTASKLSEEV